MDITSQEIYRIILKEYPDVLNIDQISAVLGVSKKTIYKLIRDGAFSSLKVGREYRVPKVTLLQYLKVLQKTEEL